MASRLRHAFSMMMFPLRTRTGATPEAVASKNGATNRLTSDSSRRSIPAICSFSCSCSCSSSRLTHKAHATKRDPGHTCMRPECGPNIRVIYSSIYLPPYCNTTDHRSRYRCRSRYRSVPVPVPVCIAILPEPGPVPEPVPVPSPRRVHSATHWRARDGRGEQRLHRASSRCTTQLSRARRAVLLPASYVASCGVALGPVDAQSADARDGRCCCWSSPTS